MPLTKQQQRATDLYRQGLKTKQIAEEMGISQGRVGQLLPAAARQMQIDQERSEFLEQEARKPMLERSVHVLEASPTIRTVLRQLELETLGSILEHAQVYYLRCPGFGVKSLKHLRSALQEYGVDISQWPERDLVYKI